MNKTRLSKKEHNYALSFCARRTFYCARSLENRKLIIHDIIEPDPWQEVIMKNFEEFSRKAEELDLEYYRYIATDSESDFDSD